MNAALRYGLQVLLYGAFAATLGYLSTSPAFEPLAARPRAHPPLAQPRRAAQGRLPHALAEELAKLAPNMRAAEDCPRERAPVRVQASTSTAYAMADIVAPPAGLSRDGASVAYRRIPVPAGTHRLRVSLADDAAGTFDRVREEDGACSPPGRVLVIDFEPGKGGIVLR